MIPRWAMTLPWNLIDKYARRHSLDPALVGAIVQVESGGNGYAMRYEPKWDYLLTPEKFAKMLGITEETERQMQRFSYGVMQVMGSVARELGFQSSLAKLTHQGLGIEFGCLKLKQLLTKYPHLTDAVAAYNAGSPRKTPEGFYVNQIYVDKVAKCHVDLS